MPINPAARVDEALLTGHLAQLQVAQEVTMTHARARDYTTTGIRLQEVIRAATEALVIASALAARQDLLQKIEKRMEHEAAQAKLEAEGAETLCRHCLGAIIWHGVIAGWVHEDGTVQSHLAEPPLVQR